MWGQYAAGHYGVYLVFDRQLLVEQASDSRLVLDNDVWSFGYVHYRDRAINLDLDVAAIRAVGVKEWLDEQAVRERLTETLYFTKNIDWESEREYRIVLVRWDLPQPEIDEPVPVPHGASLKAIVFGENYAGSMRRVEEERGRGVEVMRCDWANGAPLLIGA